jgi:hypothetical protein
MSNKKENNDNEVELEFVSDIKTDIQCMFYSYNIIILN